MIQVYRIDEEGYFVEPVLVPDEKSIPEDCVTEFPSYGLFKPKWDGGRWVEGLSEEEIKAILEKSNKPQPPTIEEQIQQLREEKKMTDLALLELVELVLGNMK